MAIIEFPKTRRALRRERSRHRSAHPASPRSFFCIGRLLLLGTAIGWGTGRTLAQDVELRAPVSGVTTVSATYGEFAPGSAHAGIDVPVPGPPLEISAAADGEIARIRLSPVGYGRALTLVLPDGREIVYAHLSRFMPAIEDSCAARQLRTADYTVDWTPPRGTFPVRRGELIGETGETDDGRRFLHLEVRVNGAPRNPLRSGFHFPDHTRPRIDALRFVPLGPTSRVDGRLETVEVPLDLLADRNNSGPRVILWGPIGIESIAHDDIQGQRRSPWQMRMEVDGALYFEGDVGERIIEGRWDADSPDGEVADRFVQRLYRPTERDRGRLSCGTSLQPGFHRLRVIVRDVGGLADTVKVSVLVRPPLRVEEWTARACGSGVWDLGVRVGPPVVGDPESIRLWIDQTEDGRRFPISTSLGHIGAGWFLGEVSSIIPSGRIGLRARMRTPDGIETWEPALSLDRSGGCAAAIVDSPSVVARPRWLDIRMPVGCLPAVAPTAALQVPGGTVSCELLEVPPDANGQGQWRWLAPPRRGRAGATPYFDLRLDGSTRRWKFGTVVLATPGDDLLWSSPDGALTLEIPAATFYGPVWLLWSRSVREEERIPVGEIEGVPHSRNEQVEVLLVRSDIQGMTPSDLEIDGPFRVSIRPTTAPESAAEAKRLGIYARHGSEKAWRYLGGIWTGSALVAIADALGEWVVLEDRTEPWLYALDPAPGDRRMGPLSTLRASIREDGSGLDLSGLEAWLDGRRLPVAWKPQSRSATVTLAGPMAEGNHQWEVRAVDRAGNSTRRVASFSVVR